MTTETSLHYCRPGMYTDRWTDSQTDRQTGVPEHSGSNSTYQQYPEYQLHQGVINISY